MSGELAEFVAGVRLHAREATTKPFGEEGSRSEAKGAGGARPAFEGR